ncbi:unnamed protein product [Paramecium pentaurelia]|uniref:NACHT domain-containing protein n=1 Tax=Paramecium pentaurelia TaxID=43138 RepID=A0A8S1W1H2_9CILI|nr:unnamed protein product [Paramecium pentaurelia]
MITYCLKKDDKIQVNQSLKKLQPLSCQKCIKNIQYNFSLQFTRLSNCNFYSQDCANNDFKKLRGGGCGLSVGQVVENQKLDQQLQKSQDQITSKQLPNNFSANLIESFKLIVDEARLFCEANKRNEIIKKIQWLIYNREYLNYYCCDEQANKAIYETAKTNFESLLKVLITYLRNSGFICYQILLICNELLRIMYVFQFREKKRFLKDEDKQNYIQKLSEFETQLEIEQANVWKTGFEFEIKIMKIMIINQKTDSTEGQDTLINFFKEAGKSIISLSPSEDLLSTIIEGGKYLLKKGIEKKLYPIETYQTYYLFQLIKWSIIKSLKSQLSVYKQISQLKDIFQQYIFVSDNWIIHFSWIQMIIDIIAYRPIINKSDISMNQQDQQLIKWNQLIENNLIHCVTFKEDEAIMNLFLNQEKQIYDIELTRELDKFSKKKFVLFNQFLLKGDLTQNVNQWDYYKEFTFKKQKDKKQEDYEIILASYEIEILQKLINNLKSQQDELLSIHSGIIESFQTYFKQPSQMLLQIIQDDQQATQKQFLQVYKQLIILSNYFKELSKFEVSKLDLLKPYLDKFKNKENQKNLLDLKTKIDNFQNTELIEFIDQLLNNFLIAIEFTCITHEMQQFLDSKNQTDLEKLIKKLDTDKSQEKFLGFEIDKFKKIFTTFENNFNQFYINLRSYKENFIKFIQKELDIKSMTIQIQDQNTLQIIEYYQYKDKSINKLLLQKWKEKYQLFDSELRTLENVQQNFIDCKSIIITLQFLKQFINIQSQQMMIIKQQLENYNQQTNLTQNQVNVDKKQTINDILTQQLQKIEPLIIEDFSKSDQETIDFNLKSLLSQIESDFNLIKSECQKQENQDNNHSILSLLTNAQFIILQILNKNTDLSNQQGFLKSYQQSLNDFNQKAKINKEKFENEENKEKEEKEQQLNDSSLILFNKILDDDQQLIISIKEIKKQYKFYEKLLILQIELILQQKNIIKDKVILEQDQQNQQLSSQPDKLNQIKKIKEMREQHFNQKVKDSIEKLFNNFEIQFKNDNKLIIKLKFTDFLQFFYSLSNSEYQKGLKADQIEDSIWQDIKNTYKETKDKVVDLLDFKPDQKVREGFVYSLIRLQYSVQEQKVKGFCCQYLQYIWVFEKDQRVRNLLKNKELVEIQKQLFAQYLDNLSLTIKDELKLRMQKLESLQQEIKLEGNLQKREELQIQLKKTYDELDESLDNISEMSDKMDISLIFLKDISKDVKQIKASIDNLQESINQVGDDIRKLRGKRYDELLEIRKQKILLQSKLTEVDSVYVQLTTIEYDPISGQIIKSNDNEIRTKLLSEQQNDFKGEVNEFIWDKNSQKDVMLVSGFAGSGKSKAARKIEEFLWKQKGTQSKWIPIYVSLPTLKNPKFNLFEQALESENYQFDKYQIKEFREAIQTQKEFIILILDSYDEMKQDCIQSNLLLTNKLIQEFNTTNIQMKVIITTRKEILNTVGYQTWFYGQSLQSLKEVQLQNFNEDQQNEYLNQYVELSIKRKIKEIYEFVKQIAGQGFDLDEFLNIWGLISQQVKNYIEKSEIKGLEGIFFNNTEELIIAKIKTHKTLEILKEEQTTTLRKDLLALWSANKFKSSIKSVNIENLLTTPFMLEIVVQVLPNMTKKYQGSQQMKELFINNYLKLKKQVRISKITRELYQTTNQQLKKNEQDEEQQISQEKEEEYQQKNEKARIIQIVDMLDNENFFSKYQIVSQLNYKENAIIIDNTNISIGSNEIQFIIMALQMKRFTVFEFYESFINFYHEQQIQKQRELGKIYNQDSFSIDIYQYSYSLAIDMTIRELSQIGYKPLGKLDLKSNYKIDQIIDDWLKQYFDIEDEYKKLIRSCILLSAKGSTFSFTHKSIQEFFVAKYIYDLLTSLNSFESKILKDKEENLEKNKKMLINSVFNNSKFNISTDNFRGSINFIREHLTNVENINSQLIEIVKLSRSKDYCRAASNSIPLLSQMNVYLESQDFKGIQLANTDMSGLSLFDCDLSNSIFENVDINSCNFNFADLSNIKWTNVICKEKPFLQGHQNGVLEVRFSPDGKFIVSIEEQDNKIKLWDADKYQFIQDLVGHQDKVNTISFSSDSPMLYSGSDDGTILRWDFKNPQQITSVIVETFDNKVLKVKISQDSKKLYLQDDQFNFFILDLTKNGKREEYIPLLKKCVDKDEKFIEVTEMSQISEFALHPKKPKIALAYDKDELPEGKDEQDTVSTIKLIDYVTLEQQYLKYNRLVSQFEKKIQGQGLVFSDDGQYFAVVTDNQAIVWNYKQNTYQIQIQLQFQRTNKSNSIFFSQKNELVICEQNFAYKCQNYQPQEKQECIEIQISPLGNIAAAVYEKKLSILDLNTQNPISSISFDFQPNTILFSKNGSKLSLFLKNEGRVKQFKILEVSTLNTICFIPIWNKYWINYILSNNFEKLFIQYKEEYKYFGKRQYHANDDQFKLVIQIDTNKIHKEIENKEFCISSKRFCAQYQSGVIAYIKLNTNAIKIYDLDKNQEIEEDIQYEENEVLDLLFSPTQKELAVLYKNELLFWNIESKPFQIKNKIIQLDSNLKSINYSPDGSRIVLEFQKSFNIYEVKSCKLLKTVEHDDANTKVSISLDNDLIGYIQDTQIIILSQKNNYKQTVLQGHNVAIYNLIFTRDQQSIISAGSGELILWDLSKFQIKDQKNTYIKEYQITFSYSTQLLVLFKQNLMQLWKYSQNQLTFIGSQVFDFRINELSFIHDDQHILIKQSDTELLLCNLDNFQYLHTFQLSFEQGAISSDNVIALAEEDNNIKLYLNNLEKDDYQLQDFSQVRYLTFLENKQNLLFIQGWENIYIWDLIKGQKISKFQLFEYQTVKQLQLKGEILISQNEYNVSLWDLSDLNNIKICGFHNKINCFSIQDNQEFGLGIINQQWIIIKNIFNVELALPANKNELIRKVFMSIKKQYYIILSTQLFILEINTKQIHQFDKSVFAVAYCEERDYIAVQTQSELQLIQFQQNSFNIISSIDLQKEKYQSYKITFTNDGQGLSLNSSDMIKWFSITKNQKIICRGMFDKKEFRKIQAQIFCDRGSSNKQQLLAVLDQNEKKFRIINIQKQKQFVQIQFKQVYCQQPSLSFELSFNEDKIFFLFGKEQIFSLDINNFEKKELNHYRFLENRQIRVIGSDSLVFVKEKYKQGDLIIQYQVSKSCNTQITLIQDITYMNYLPQQQLLAISTKSNNIIFWDIKAKKNIGTLTGHQDTINHITVSPFDGVLASVSKDRLIKLWTINQNESSEVQQGHSYSISSIAYSQDGQLLASGAKKGEEQEVPIFLWDVIDKKLMIQLKKHKCSITSLEFSYCSRYLVSGDDNGIIVFWNIEYPQFVKVVYVINEFNCSINSISISKTEQTLFAVYNSNLIIKWNYEQIEKQIDEKHLILNTTSKLYSFIQNDQFVYFDTDQNKLIIHNIETKEQKCFQMKSKINQLQTSEDGNLILGLQSTKYEKTYNLLCFQKQDINTWYEKQIFGSQADYFLLSPDNKFLYSRVLTFLQYYQNEKQPKVNYTIYDFQRLSKVEKKLFCKINENSLIRIFVSYDFTLIAVVINNQRLKIYDNLKQQYIKEFKECQNPGYVQISKDNKYLAYLELNEQNKPGNIIFVFNIEDPSIKRDLKCDQNEIIIYKFSAKDSNQIYALYKDQTVRHWDLTDKQPSIKAEVTLSKSFDFKSSFKFSHNLNFLINRNWNQQSLIIWDFRKKEEFIINVEQKFDNFFCSQNEDIYAVISEQQKDMDCIIIFKDKKQSKIIQRKKQQDTILTIEFSHNDEQMIICQFMSIYLYQIDVELKTQILGFWYLDLTIQNCFLNPMNMSLVIQTYNDQSIFEIQLEPIIFKQYIIEQNQDCQYRICCFSPDSQYLAILCPYLQLQNLQDCQMIHEFKEYQGSAISFQSIDILVIANQCQLQFFNIKKNENKVEIIKIREFSFQSNMFQIGFSQTHLFILFNVKKDINKSPKKRIALVEINNLKQNEEQLEINNPNQNILKAIYHYEGSLAFQESGNYFAISYENKIQILNTQTLFQQERCFYLKENIEISQIFYMSDENLIMFFFNFCVQILDSTSFEMIRQKDQISGCPEQVEYSKISKYLVFKQTNIIEIYTFENNEKDFLTFDTFQINDDIIFDNIALSQKGDLLLTGEHNSKDFTNSITLWNIGQRKQICTNNKINNKVTILKFCPDGVTFAAGLEDGSINLYSIEISKTNFFKQQSKLNKNFQKFQIICIKSFSKQSLLTAQQSILTADSNIISENKSIVELFYQKGGLKPKTDKIEVSKI